MICCRCYAVDADLKKESDLEATSQNITHFHLKTEFLLPNDVDSVPNAPFLILLSHFEDMRFQISNVLRE